MQCKKKIVLVRKSINATSQDDANENSYKILEENEEEQQEEENRESLSLLSNAVTKGEKHRKKERKGDVNGIGIEEMDRVM